MMGEAMASSSFCLDSYSSLKASWQVGESLDGLIDGGLELGLVAGFELVGELVVGEGLRRS